MARRPRLAINGFGRIGRAITKLNMKYQKFDLVLINDINPNCDNLVYLLNCDSTNPHSAFFSQRAFQEMRENAALNVKRILDGQEPLNIIKR